MVILCPSKEETWDALHAIDDYLQMELGLELNNKTSVIPVGKKIEFVGRKISPACIELRKQTTLQMKKHLAYVMEHYATGELPFEYCNNVIQSYKGLMKHTDSDALRKQIFDTFYLSHQPELVEEWHSDIIY